MTLPLYLAMTGAEISRAEALPARCAYMAYHFSAYGTGLSPISSVPPRGAVLILNDRMPVQGHDPDTVARQLGQAAEELEAQAVLLDLQRPENARTAAIVRAVLEALPCPVAVSDLYARELTCPVFLPPPPLHQPLEQYTAPWTGRELWLEAALDSEEILVTEKGSRYTSLTAPEEGEPFHRDEVLHIHYHIQTTPQSARFTLWRTPEDLTAAFSQAERLGITRAIGLYQELGKFFQG